MNEKPSTDTRQRERKAHNLDPISGQPGAHPVGTAVGSAVGASVGLGAVGAAAMTGTVAGTAVGGPLGAAAGLVVGGLLGAVAGKAAGEQIDPTEDDDYWRSRYTAEPYYDKAKDYEHYAPAYAFGSQSASTYSERDFETAEPALQDDYQRGHGNDMAWQEVREPARSAWQRVKDRLAS